MPNNQFFMSNLYASMCLAYFSVWIHIFHTHTRVCVCVCVCVCVPFDDQCNIFSRWPTLKNSVFLSLFNDAKFFHFALAGASLVAGCKFTDPPVPCIAHMRKTTRRRFSYEKFQAQEEGATVMEGAGPYQEHSTATRFHRNNSTATATEWELERAQTPLSHRPIQQTGICHQHLTFQSSASYRNYE